MNEYVVKWKKSAVKELQCLPKEIAINILQFVGELAHNPRPANCKKLKVLANHYRIRVTDYRVVYSIFR